MRDTQLRAAAALTSADGAGQVDRTGELVKHLHDSLAQLLSFALIQLDTAQGARAGVRESALRHSRQLVKEALRSTRGLIGDLRESARAAPLAFDQQLLQMAADVSRLSQRDLQLACQPLHDALPLPVSKMLLRAARELLVNACKHAPGAAIQLSLRSTEDGAGIVLSVSDDGPGLDPHALQAESASSYGLRQLPACLALIGAELQLSSQPGAGLCARILWRPQAAEARPVGRQMTGSDEVGQ